MRPIAIVGWLGIIGALLAWQGIGLVRGPEWPTHSDFIRAFMATMPGRFALFGLWLWLGWHLFRDTHDECQHVLPEQDGKEHHRICDQLPRSIHGGLGWLSAVRAYA